MFLLSLFQTLLFIYKVHLRLGFVNTQFYLEIGLSEVRAPAEQT